MRYFLILIVLFLQLLIAQENPVAIIVKTKGKVIIERNKKEIKVELYMPLYINDKIITYSASFVEIVFDTGVSLRIEEKSIFELKKFVQNEYEEEIRPYVNFVFKLYKGGVLTEAKVFNDRYNLGSLHIITPTSVASVRGTVFYINVDEDKNTKVAVFKGKVECLLTEISEGILDSLFEEEFYELKRSIIVKEEQQIVFSEELVFPTVTELSVDMTEYKKTVVDDFIKISQKYRKKFEEFKEKRNEWIKKHKECFKKDIMERKKRFKKEFYNQ